MRSRQITVTVTLCVKAADEQDALAVVNDRIWSTLAHWYGEDRHEDVIPGEGYPRGSLLFWNTSAQRASSREEK